MSDCQICSLAESRANQTRYEIVTSGFFMYGRSVLALCCPPRSLHAQLHDVRPSAMEYIQVEGPAHMAGWGSLLGKLPKCPRRTSRSSPDFGDMSGLFSIQK